MIADKMDFTKIDELYRKADFHKDENILDILNAHKYIENVFTVEIDGLFLNHDFHKSNVEVIDHLIQNIDMGHYKSDCLIYLYSYMIYEYSGTFYDNSLIIAKYKELLNIWALNYSNTNYVLEDFTRYFQARKASWYQRDLVTFLANVNDNNYMAVFQYCRFLIFDREFCKSVFYYAGSLHCGAYVIFDTVIYKILTWRGQEKERWIEAFINFFERYSELRIADIDNYYSTLAILYKYQYLSSAENVDISMINELNKIKLPCFVADEQIFSLYLLYNQKMICLDNLNMQSDILALCDYLLEILAHTELDSSHFIITRLNWRKDKALWDMDKEKHKEWYFANIKNEVFSKNVSYVYCSPFMKQDDHSATDLFHFSDLGALKSIIENGELWLTRHDFLNDTEEIKYIREIIKTSKDSITDETLKIFVDRCLNLLNLYFGDVSKITETSDDDKMILTEINKCISNVYILSTSKQEDNLSLWHYYSAGTGCSIKINATKLRNQVEAFNATVNSRSSQIFMREIDYSGNMPQSLTDMIQAIFQQENLEDYQKEYLACVHIIYEGIFTKNPNMIQEKEFRMAVVVSDDTNNPSADTLMPKFRIGKNTFIPCVELNISPKSLIEEICIAPLNKTDIAKKGLLEFLKSKKFDNYADMVTVSKINLRY